MSIQYIRVLIAAIALSAAALAGINFANKKLAEEGQPPHDVGRNLRHGMIKYPSPPDNYTTVLGWFQALTKSSETEKSAEIVMDYVRLYELDPQGETPLLIAQVEYSEAPEAPLPDQQGGLYSRYPTWYQNDDHDPIFNSIVKNGYLSIDVSQTPDKNIHWWTPRASAKKNFRYFLETKVKITGNVSLRIGADYWKGFDSVSNGFDESCSWSNNCEAWLSPWYGDTGGKFETIVFPKY